MLVYESVEEPEVVGGEGLIYLATRVSRKVGGPEEIAEELNDVSRVRRLLRMVVKAGHFSVLEHSLVRLRVKADWGKLAQLLFRYKYLEVSHEGNLLLISLNPRTALEMLNDPREEVRRLARMALKGFPIIGEAVGISSGERPKLDVSFRKLSESPLVYSFVVEPYTPEVHGFYAFWAEMSRVASHQFVRHRRLSYTQRSGRYTRPDGFVLPEVGDEALKVMREQCVKSYEVYEKLLRMGLRREDARYVLPAALKTALFVSGRQSDWNHFLKLRTDVHAQEEIRRIALIIAEAVGWRR